jgi:uncharacterized protein (DUF433 family)
MPKKQIVMEDRQVDWHGCGLVESVPERVSGIPVLVGTRMPAQTIADNYYAGMSPEDIAVQWELKLSDVNAILEYRENLNARPSR